MPKKSTGHLATQKNKHDKGGYVPELEDEKKEALAEQEPDIEIQEIQGEVDERVGAFITSASEIVTKARELEMMHIVNQLEGLMETAKELRGDIDETLGMFEELASDFSKDVETQAKTRETVKDVKSILDLISGIADKTGMEEVCDRVKIIRKSVSRENISLNEADELEKEAKKLEQKVESMGGVSIEDILREVSNEANFKKRKEIVVEKAISLMDKLKEESDIVAISSILEEVDGGEVDEDVLNEMEKTIKAYEDRFNVEKEVNPTVKKYRETFSSVLKSMKYLEILKTKLESGDAVLIEKFNKDNVLASIDAILEKNDEGLEFARMDDEDILTNLEPGGVDVEQIVADYGELVSQSDGILENVRFVKSEKKVIETKENEEEVGEDLEELKKHVDFFKTVAADLNFKKIRNELKRHNNKYELNVDDNNEAHEIASRLVDDFHDFKNKGYEDMSDDDLQKLLDSGNIKLENIEKVTEDINRLLELTGLELEEPEEEKVEDESEGGLEKKTLKEEMSEMSLEEKKKFILKRTLNLVDKVSDRGDIAVLEKIIKDVDKDDMGEGDIEEMTNFIQGLEDVHGVDVEEKEEEPEGDLEELKKHIEFFKTVADDLNFKLIKNELNRKNNKYRLGEEGNKEAYDIASRLVDDFYNFKKRGYENMSDEELQKLLDSEKVDLAKINEVSDDIKRLSELTGLELEDQEKVEDKDFAEIIGGASSIDELKSLIRENNITLEGSKDKVFTPEMLINTINDYISGEKDATVMTRAGGLRNKVVELFAAEGNEEKDEADIEKEKIPENKKAVDDLLAVYQKISALLDRTGDMLSPETIRLAESAMDPIAENYGKAFDKLAAELDSDRFDAGEVEEIDWNNYPIETTKNDIEKLTEVSQLIIAELAKIKENKPDDDEIKKPDDDIAVPPVDLGDTGLRSTEELNLERDTYMAKLIEGGMSKSEARSKAEFLVNEKEGFNEKPEMKAFVGGILEALKGGAELTSADFPEMLAHFSPEVIDNIIKTQESQVNAMAQDMERKGNKGFFKKALKFGASAGTMVGVAFLLANPLGAGAMAAAVGVVGARTAWNLVTNLRKNKNIEKNKALILEHLTRADATGLASGESEGTEDAAAPEDVFAGLNKESLINNAVTTLFEAEKRKISGEYKTGNVPDMGVLKDDALTSLEDRFPGMNAEDREAYAEKIALMLHMSKNNENKEAALADKRKDHWVNRVRESVIGKLPAGLALEGSEKEMANSAISTAAIGVGFAVARNLPGFAGLMGAYAGFKAGGALGNIAERKLVYKFKNASQYGDPASMNGKEADLLRQQMLYYPDAKRNDPEYLKLSELHHNYLLEQVKNTEKIENLATSMEEDNDNMSKVDKSMKRKKVAAGAVAVTSRLAGAGLGWLAGNAIEDFFDGDEPIVEPEPVVPEIEPFTVQDDYLERMMNNAQARFIDENMVPGGQLDGVEAGKMLNVTHNILKMMDGKLIAGIAPEIDGVPVSDFVNYDAQTNTLSIVDPEKFEQLVDKLWGRSPVTELTANGSGAVAGAGGYSEGTWDNMLKDSKIDLAGGAETLRGDAHVQAAMENMNAAQQASLNAAFDGKEVNLSMTDAYNGYGTLPGGEEIKITNGLIESVDGEKLETPINAIDRDQVYEHFHTDAEAEVVAEAATEALTTAEILEQASQAYKSELIEVLKETKGGGIEAMKSGWLSNVKAKDMLNPDYEYNSVPLEKGVFGEGTKEVFKKVQNVVIENAKEFNITADNYLPDDTTAKLNNDLMIGLND